MASPPRRAVRNLSARTYLLIVFLADAAGFFLLGCALEGWGGAPVDWGKVTGIALLMGFVTADLARRLGGMDTGEERRNFAAYWSGTRWIVFFWASLVLALALSWAAVLLVG